MTTRLQEATNSRSRGLYFVDGGANNGSSVRLFRHITPNWPTYIVHSFDPNPAMAKYFHACDGVVFHPEAIWIQDTELPFYLGKTAAQDGSSLMKTKMTGKLDKLNPLKVKCIDFGAWLKTTFTPSDYVVLKLDIEGAEYDVLEKMITDGSIKYIAKLYVEFHWSKLGLPEARHCTLIKSLLRYGLIPEPWDAQQPHRCPGPSRLPCIQIATGDRR